MKIVFNSEFYNSDYASDGASVPGRMESIMRVLEQSDGYEIEPAVTAAETDLLLAHTPALIALARKNPALFEMACLAAGAGMRAAELGAQGKPAFACVRPPGHHASRAATWNYCVFCNVGIALLHLKKQGLIQSAFVIDFDAHTGDGTIDVLSGWPEAMVLNPYGDTNRNYVHQIEDRLKEIDYVDIVAVSAGFDSGVNDLGGKLETFDFYQIGRCLKQFTKRMGHQRRFAVLEGGYFQPDLGKNVLSFCEGFR